MIPDTFPRRSQLIPPEKVRVPYLYTRIQSQVSTALHSTPIQALEYDEATDDEEEDREEKNSLRVAGELRRGGIGGGFGAACTRSGAQGRVPARAQEAREGEEAGRCTRGGKPLVRPAAFGGLVRRKRGRSPAGELVGTAAREDRRRNVLSLIRSR